MNDTNAGGPALDARAAELLEAWFDDAARDPGALAARMTWWFGSDPQRDAGLQQRFGDLAAGAANGELAPWSATPRGRLALILLLDQLPRNCFRASARAFATDGAALAETQRGVAAGDDRRLTPVERLFFYMPLQHAEDAAIQRQSVDCYARLAAEAPAGTRPTFDAALRFAQLHREIVERFGRFPHRNAILGRDSTAAELEWLAADAPDFGQRR